MKNIILFKSGAPGDFVQTLHPVRRFLEAHPGDETVYLIPPEYFTLALMASFKLPFTILTPYDTTRALKEKCDRLYNLTGAPFEFRERNNWPAGISNIEIYANILRSPSFGGALEIGEFTPTLALPEATNLILLGDMLKFPEQPVILHYHSRTPVKDYPEMERLAGLLVANLHPLILLKAEGKAQSNQEPFKLAKMALHVGYTDYVTLASLIKYSILFVGPDSFPLHLAAALGAPVIGIFGPTGWEIAKHYSPALSIQPKGMASSASGPTGALYNSKDKADFCYPPCWTAPSRGFKCAEQARCLNTIDPMKIRDVIEIFIVNIKKSRSKKNILQRITSEN